MMFDPVPTPARFADIDRNILEFWHDQQIPRKSFEKRGPRGEYVFFEGPPTANGKPGIHHVLTRVFKDLVLRYKTMSGYRVRRRGGWDTHGLPVEIEIEKQIGSTGKQDIEKYGIAAFNQLCRESVFRYIKDWDDLTERSGFWLDLDNAYVTYHNTYIETCWWILKNFWDRGLLYEDYRTTMHCPRCNSTLADHEVSQGMKDEVDDPSIWPKFRANPDSLRAAKIIPEEFQHPVDLLAWTTTPWTLGANVALAVNADVQYALVKAGPEYYILARDRATDTFGENQYQVERVFPGTQLAGVRYEPLMLGYVPPGTDMSTAYRVVVDPLVTMEDGTGVVHIAPAYGDLEPGRKHGLPTIFSVDLDGHMFSDVRRAGQEPGAYAGLFFKEADNVIIRDLLASGGLFRAGRIAHAYPFCWRDDSPLLFYAKNSWYIRTSLLKEQLIDNNRKINWIPEHIREGRFGTWLENNVDWAISRERYWGAPLPVWISEDGEDKICVGSVAELEKLVGRSLSGLDLHRPAVDEISFDLNGKRFRRLPYTVDVWFESGSMPYGQWHFPFENQDEFRHSFPADFILEAMDQTRGWFYSLHAIATLLSYTGGADVPAGPLAGAFPNTSAFRNCMVLGFINDAAGQKMSKSRGNTVDPWQILDRFGADPLRWYLYTVTAPDLNKNFDVEQLNQVVRGYFLTLWNCYSFFVTYANLDKPCLSDPPPVSERPDVDRWVLAAADSLVVSVSSHLDNFDVAAGARAIADFVHKELSNWYIRLNRRRFWKSDDDRDKRAAYVTLYEVLGTVVKLSAPFAPFVTEAMYQNLVRKIDSAAPLSVHLSEWPQSKPEWRDQALIEDMETVSRVVETGRALRSKAGLKVRQPLANIALYGLEPRAARALERFAGLVKDELNVKAIEVLREGRSLFGFRSMLDVAQAGSIFGSKLPAVRTALAAADPNEIASNHAAGAPIPVQLNGDTVEIDPRMVILTRVAAPGYAVAELDRWVMGLDTTITEELRNEGLARDLVRLVQEARKKAKLDVADRINLSLSGSADIAGIIQQHKDYIAGEVLATSITVAPAPAYPFRTSAPLSGSNVEIAFERQQ
jgi:isoleucyl-tRNA synthetase